MTSIELDFHLQFIARHIFHTYKFIPDYITKWFES